MLDRTLAIIGLAVVVGCASVTAACNDRRQNVWEAIDQTGDAAAEDADALHLPDPPKDERVFDAAPPFVRCGVSDDAGDAAGLDGALDGDASDAGDANSACAAPGAVCAGPGTLVRFADGVCIGESCTFPTTMVACDCVDGRCREPIQE